MWKKHKWAALFLHAKIIPMKVFCFILYLSHGKSSPYYNVLKNTDDFHSPAKDSWLWMVRMLEGNSTTRILSISIPSVSSAISGSYIFMKRISFFRKSSEKSFIFHPKKCISPFQVGIENPVRIINNIALWTRKTKQINPPAGPKLKNETNALSDI